MTTQEQADQHQAEVSALTDVAALSVQQWFADSQAAGVTTLALLRLALFDLVSAVVDQFGSAASAVAADWYEELREDARARGMFVPRLASLPPGARLNALVGWATSPPRWVQDATDNALTTDPTRSSSALDRSELRSLIVPDVRIPGASAVEKSAIQVPMPDLTVTAARVREAQALRESPAVRDTTEVPSDFSWVQDRVIAGTQRIVADAARDTVIESALADPVVIGWQRMSANGGDCAFCTLLIGRGAVYRESTVKFGAHDNCDCVAAPVFDDETVGAVVDVDTYKPTNRKITDADRARVRAWMKVNGLT